MVKEWFVRWESHNGENRDSFRYDFFNGVGKLLDGSMNFFEKVYEVVKQIPYGKVMSYGQIACIIGCPRMARQVGWALHGNPDPERIPCYRVVNKDGRVSPAFAFGGENAQIALLQKEGVEFDRNGLVKREYFVKESDVLAKF